MHAQKKGWIVLYFPRSVELVNSSTRHVYDLRTQTYLQPDKTLEFVSRVLRANAELLEKVKLREPVVADKLNVPAGTSLAALAEALVKGKNSTPAPVVLEYMLKELESQTEVPVLVAVDDLQSLYHPSAYKDPFWKNIQAHHLSLPRILLEYASGKRVLNKGAFLGALNCSDTQFGVPLELRDTLGLEYAHPTSPYEKRDSVHLEYAEGLKKIEVAERLTVKEAASLFEVWKDDMALPSGAFLV